MYNNISKNNYGVLLMSSSNNNTIKGNNVSLNTRVGFDLWTSLDNNITNNNFINDGIFIWGEQLSHFNTHTIPTSNIVNNKPLYYYKDCSGISIDGIPVGQLILANCNGITLKNLQIDNTNVGIEIAYSMNVDASKANLSNNRYGVYLKSSSNINITNNDLLSDSSAIHISTSSNNNILGNMVSLSTYSFYIELSSNNNITGNNISNNWDGIILDSSSYNNITSNNISSSDLDGILFEWSTNNKITWNNISSNTRHGIYLWSSSNNNTMANNNVSSNNEYGIYLESSSNNNITENNISNNLYGIHIESSLNNKIYHNNIIENVNQASDDVNSNFWNDTYPSGGNYWSHYCPTCQDLHNGAVTPQITGSSDGICDSQYDIDVDSMDYYPLTTPFPPPPTPPTNLSAELTGDNFENVTISFNASLDDPGKVTNYAIYYNTNYDSNGSNYEFLTEVFATGASKYYLIILGIGEGDPNSYFFYVQANGTSGFGKSDRQVAKFTRSLTSSKHLISLPLIFNNTNIPNALQTLKFDIAWYYDNADLLKPWKSYNPSKSFNDLATVNHTMAFLMNIIENSNLTVAGLVPNTTNIFLNAGWNFVGYPSFIERNVSDALSAIIYERIEGYENAPPQYLKLCSDSDIMIPGFGFWIKVPFDQTWILTNN